MRERFHTYAFYTPDADKGRVFGQLAMHLWHSDATGMLMDAGVFLKRKDIAYITVKDLKHSRTKETITSLAQLNDWLEEGEAAARKLAHP